MRPEVAASGEEASFPAVRTLRFTVDGAGDSKREYEAVAVQFANAWQLFLTHSGKVGTWLCASADAPHADVYSVKTLIGDRLQEHLAVYARSLVKTLCDSLRTRSSLELDREFAPPNG
ncbi:hypothetical protein BBBOND_0110330 [Babesia bigemina]|uniref:Uncharacterized protein n=1 Tax=Babesia bigemina TaxID=5866 RepID=A0A061DAI8_BABBI|nr:hypothetical protein BBBOND_0110330 [Babesia bigemina]CDR94735.1 hypothetical protein BBBOND_0110330 [Babesia bigemina]|eukprot:XP_012766921.1 hypothetical protein BBBOND_0110330 [Babesia bigemina]